ncbi:MAG: nucleoside monophosphate kinase [Candidatus Aenigmarchaeota archaeon]|nr:nucleoside monophosphate kinase [Candidatus Aenigmarchaeota archaeon]
MKIIMLGAPGAGKGTYASKILAPELNVPHISTGDLFRAEAVSGSELSAKIKEIIDKGDLVPDEIVIDMLKNRLGQDDAQNGFILDGFPRNMEQAKMLDEITDVDFVLNVRLADEIIIKKIAGRRICRKCGYIYNVADIHEGGIDMPPLLPEKEGICDKCSGELYQRDDDAEAIVRDRLKLYYEKTAPLIEYYEKRGIVKNIDVNGGPDIMRPVILKLIGKA